MEAQIAFCDVVKAEILYRRFQGNLNLQNFNAMVVPHN
jgi:hypothetical protein